jgi:hypothetical protein
MTTNNYITGNSLTPPIANFTATPPAGEPRSLSCSPVFLPIRLQTGTGIFEMEQFRRDHPRSTSTLLQEITQSMTNRRTWMRRIVDSARLPLSIRRPDNGANDSGNNKSDLSSDNRAQPQAHYRNVLPLTAFIGVRNIRNEKEVQTFVFQFFINNYKLSARIILTDFL